MPSCTPSSSYNPLALLEKYHPSSCAEETSRGTFPVTGIWIGPTVHSALESADRVLVVSGEDCDTGEKVALKTECHGATRKARLECRTYRKLWPIPGHPQCHAAYSYNDHGKVIILECFGDSLETFLRNLGGVPSIEKVYKIGRAMVQTLQAVHETGFVHGDVKPDNIILPTNGELQPYLVDFGHARRYQELEGTRETHESFGAVGTLPFMSTNVQYGMRYTPRDDIVSLAYTLIYLAHGTLPWYHCTYARQCLKQKQSFRPSQLSPLLPPALELFLDHAQSLNLDSQPDYSYLEEQLT